MFQNNTSKYPMTEAIPIPDHLIDHTHYHSLPPGQGYLLRPHFSTWLMQHMPVKLREINGRLCILLDDPVAILSFDVMAGCPGANIEGLPT